MVDLREVGRLERHAHAELGQRVGQVGAGVVDAHDGVRALGLQPPLHVVLDAERAQQRHVVLAHGLEVAQHQRGDLVADGQLDLRQPLARLHGLDQRAQRHQHVGDALGDDVALAHVGHVAGLALVESHQHRVLLRDPAHGQPRAQPVAPRRPFDRAQHQLGLDLAEVPEVVLQHALLHRHLRLRREMLHLAAAARAGMQAEVRTARRDALRALAADGHEIGLLPLLLALDDLDARLLARQRAVDEHDDAFAVVRDALRIEVDAGDLQPLVVGHARCGPRVAIPPMTAAALAAALLFCTHPAIIGGPMDSAPDRASRTGAEEEKAKLRGGRRTRRRRGAAPACSSSRRPRPPARPARRSAA